MFGWWLLSSHVALQLRYNCLQIIIIIWKTKNPMWLSSACWHWDGIGGLTERVMGPAWEVRSCLWGPAVRNSSLGVIIQNPTDGSLLIHPWTLLSLSSREYWYLSSTCAHNITGLKSVNQRKKDHQSNYDFHICYLHRRQNMSITKARNFRRKFILI